MKSERTTQALLIAILALNFSQNVLMDGQGNPNYKTVLVAELFRHGARTTTKRDKINFPFTKEIGFGNLTGNGQRMHFLRGQEIRKNYSELFNTGQEPTNFDYILYSSPLPRCIVSANSHLLGIYPPGPNMGNKVSTSQTGEGLKYMSPPGEGANVVFNNQTYPSALPGGFRAFPVISFQNIDYMFLHNGEKSCPGIGNLEHPPTQNSKEESSSFPPLDTRETIKQMNTAGFKSQLIFGESNWSTYLLSRFFDQVRAYLYYNGKQISGMSDDLYTQLRMIFTWEFFQFEVRGSPKNPIFRTTTISEQLLVNMNNKISGKNPNLKYLMFSGHDTTLYPFMYLHKMINMTCSKEMYDTYMKNKTIINTCMFGPEFAASFMWELNKNSADGQYYVRVLYNGQPVHFCQNNQDGYYCKFSDFQTEVKSRLILPNFMQICKGSQQLSVDEKVYKPITIVFMVTTGIFALTTILLLVKVNKGSKGEKSSESLESRLTGEEVDEKN